MSPLWSINKLIQEICAVQDSSLSVVHARWLRKPLDLDKFVKRKLPVNDTYKLWRGFTRRLVDRLPPIDGQDFQEHHRKRLIRLDNYAFHYRSEKYLYMERIVTDLASAWLRL